MVAWLMLLEQGMEELLPPAEIRGPEPRERVSQVDHPAAGSGVKNTERAGYFEPPSPRRYCSSAIVNEDEVGRERQSEDDRRFLAFVQPAQRRIVASDDRASFEP